MAVVLIIDDSPTELHLFQNMLEKAGYDTLVAGLEQVGQEIGMEISVRLYSVYEAMHRI